MSGEVHPDAEADRQLTWGTGRMSGASATAQPLSGCVVVDLTRFLPGALATQLLADLGADVIKVEGFPEGDYAREMEPFVGFAAINRNKRSIHVDFRTPRGAAILARLIDQADALVEVSRPGAMRRYGLDYESVRGRRADIVYCSVSAYGQRSPYAEAPSHGYNMDGMAGMLDVQFDANGAPYVGAAGHLMPSSLLGGHAAALGVCAALLHRLRTGEGAFIDASCWDCGVSGDPITSASALSGVPMVTGFASARTPKYAPYLTADGRVLMACVIEQKFWRAFCDLIQRSDLTDVYDGSHSSDLGQDSPWVYEEVARAIASKTLAEWEDVFAGAGLPVTPVKTRAEALASAQAEARGIVLESGPTEKPHRMAGAPLVINGARGLYRNPAPGLGQHTDDVLRALGFSPSEIAVLHADGVVSAGARA